MHEASDAVSRYAALRGIVSRALAQRGVLLRRVPVGALVAAVVIPLVGCDTGPNLWFHKRASACPRAMPQSSTVW